MQTRFHHSTAVIALLLALGAMGPTPTRAQERGALVGVVRDSAGALLGHADVVLQPLGRSAVTGRDGTFRWRDLVPGEYRLTVSLIGYGPREMAVRVGAGGTSQVEIRLGRTPLALHGIEVTGNPLGRSPAGVMQATAQLSGRALERELGATVAQTLRNQPGVAVRWNGPAAAMPILRGLTGDRVLMLQDGQRSADLAGSAADHALTVDPLGAQRVEVVRGPATLLYGTSALGGVVNVISGDVAGSVPGGAEYSVTAQAESAQPGGSLGVRAALPLGEQWTLVARVGARRVAELRIPRDSLLGTRLDNTDAHNWSASLATSRVSARWTAGAALRGYAFGYGLPVAPGAAPVRLRGDRAEGVVRLETLLGGALASLRVDGTVQRYAHDELDQHDVAQQRFALATRTVNATVRQGRLGPFAEGAFGVSLLSRGYAATGPAALTPAADALAWGAFVFEEVRVPAAIPVLQLGGRFDEYRIESRRSAKFGPGVPRRFRAWTGSAGLRQALGAGIDASLTAATSFRAPTVEELFSGAPHAGTGAVEYGTPSLRAERGRSLEALLHWRRERVSAQLSAYHNRITDFVQLTFERDTVIGTATLPVFTYGQGRATVKGVEGALEVALSRSWSAGLRGDALHAEDAAGRPLSFMPPPRLGGHLRFEGERFSAGAELHHEFAQERTGSAAERPTPAHTLLRLDGGVRLRLGSHTHSLSLRAENLGDELHREATSRIKDFAPGPGRNLALVYRTYF